jgi:hypothetical protein
VGTELPAEEAVEQPEMIETILAHLGLWPTPGYNPPDSIAA